MVDGYKQVLRFYYEGRGWYHVPGELLLPLEEGEAELAEKEIGALAVLGGEGGEVPGVDLVAAQLDAGDVLHLRELLVLAQTGSIEVLMALDPKSPTRCQA